MGIFKQVKDMKTTVAAAPGVIDQANQLAEQSSQLAATQQDAAQQATSQAPHAAAAPAEGPDFEPIAGVSLELYVEISKGLSAYNYDQSKLVEVAASKGVDAGSWDSASRGWNDRIKANPAVAQRFNLLYRAA